MIETEYSGPNKYLCYCYEVAGRKISYRCDMCAGPNPLLCRKHQWTVPYMASLTRVRREDSWLYLRKKIREARTVYCRRCGLDRFQVVANEAYAVLKAKIIELETKLRLQNESVTHDHPIEDLKLPEEK